VVCAESERKIGTKGEYHLMVRRYQLFTPVLKDKKNYCDQARSIEGALFPGDIFGRLDADREMSMFSSPTRQYLVSFSGVPAAVPDETIEAIQRAIEAGNRCLTWQDVKIPSLNTTVRPGPRSSRFQGYRVLSFLLDLLFSTARQRVEIHLRSRSSRFRRRLLR